MRWIVLLLSVCLTACIPVGEEVLQTYDAWLGTTSFTTQEREIFRGDDGKGLMTARPVIVTGPQGRAYGVLTNVRRRDTNGPVVDRMTSGNVILDYVPHDRLFTHCIDGCQRAEVGAITLNARAFRLAAVTGLPLRVWGRRGWYEGTVPAEAFARVLAMVERPP
ncbi:hypothetical protein SAMN05444339_101949 [Loktanella atrilutea]|uniref:Uncharacterized protein n=1 Tax=Loktanella atrilutea TaxID=366533 RepID=A0A1M4V514_LOKAT|nr:hypothetical protein [Loktanella atrilutea]SHE64010.1 hypothetical protein SAMN05444339_101949 [Loktanella atrilutea]